MPRGEKWTRISADRATDWTEALSESDLVAAEGIRRKANGRRRSFSKGGGTKGISRVQRDAPRQ